MNTGLDRQIDTDADDEAVSTDGRNSETMVARCLLSYPVIRVPDQDISTELTGPPDQVLKSIPRPMQGRPLTVRQAETASFRDSRVGRTYPPSPRTERGLLSHLLLKGLGMGCSQGLQQTHVQPGRCCFSWSRGVKGPSQPSFSRGAGQRPGRGPQP